jgi:hypothetical protein
VCVEVECRVRAALPDLGQPDVGRVAEPGVRPEGLDALAVPVPQLVLERGLRAGLGRAPAGHAAGDAVEVAHPTAGDPAAVLALGGDRAVVPEGERRTSQGARSRRVRVE